MKFRSESAAAVIVLAAWIMSGCEVDKQTQPWPAPSKNDVGQADIPLKNGFYKGRAYTYWEAGDAVPRTSAIYILTRDGSRSPIPFTEQYPIVDAVDNGAANYSPFRHVIDVTVPATYIGNSLTSVSDLAEAFYLEQAVPTFTAWDAPSVLESATLGGSPEATPMPVWFEGQVSYAFKLEEGIRVDRNTLEVAIGTFYEISRAGEVLPDNTIFALRPGDPGYSALVRQTVVNVTEAYPAEGTPRWQSSIAIDLNLGGYLIDQTETATIHNHPRQEIGGYTLSDADLGFVDDSNPDLYPTGEVPERTVWYEGQARTYSDMGRTPEFASDVWLLHRVGGSPIEGQNAIVVSVPGDSAYSAIRRLHRVYLDSSAEYAPNSIKSYETLVQTGAADDSLEQGWNAPVVNRNARWDDASPQLGWVDGRRFAYFLLQEDLSVVNGQASVMPSFEVFRQLDLSDTVGVWLEFNSLIPAVPGMDAYSPVREVTHILVNPSYPDTAFWKSFRAASNNEGVFTAAVPRPRISEPEFANRPVRP